jgi:hypothetical protein
MTDAARLLIDQFLDPSRRGEATHRLAALGTPAVPVIASVLDGSARNQFGISLRSVSAEVARCALVSARHLGQAAAPLEPLLRAELSSEFAWLRTEAAGALAGLESVSEETLVALAALLDSGEEAAFEGATAIVRLGLCEHPAVAATVDASPRARHNLAAARRRIRGE